MTEVYTNSSLRRWFFLKKKICWHIHLKTLDKSIICIQPLARSTRAKPNARPLCEAWLLANKWVKASASVVLPAVGQQGTLMLGSRQAGLADTLCPGVEERCDWVLVRKLQQFGHHVAIHWLQEGVCFWGKKKQDGPELEKECNNVDEQHACLLSKLWTLKIVWGGGEGHETRIGRGSQSLLLQLLVQKDSAFSKAWVR